MAIIDILLPKMGESVAEATIINLLVEAGSSVEADEAVVEIATDKVDSEVPAPEDGVLLEWLVSKDDIVQVGDPIARFEIGGEAVIAPVAVAIPVAESAPVVESKSSPDLPAPPESKVSAPISEPNSAPERTGASGRFYSPLVRSIAIEEGVSMEELEKISGTGSEGRVTKKDMLAYLLSRGATPNDPSPAISESSMDVHPSFKSISGGYEVVEMDRMRKLIAKHMVDSVHTSPHVTSFVEADVTSLVLWRNKNKNKFLEKFGEKLTFTPLLAEAIVKAIGDFPGVNASVDGDNVIMHKGIHLGMAAALPSGNLIVPVIKNADSFNLQGLTRAVNDLSKRAREGKLGPDDVSGGTYTMSNVGTFGNVMGTPIINQPQVGIIALGAIRKNPR